MAKERGERSLMARAHLALGAVHLVRGEPSGALGEVGQARDLAHEIEDAHLEVESLLALARLHVFLGQLPRAVTLLEMGDKRAGELGLSLIRPELQLGLASARLAQARPLPSTPPSAPCAQARGVASGPDWTSSWRRRRSSRASRGWPGSARKPPSRRARSRATC